MKHISPTVLVILDGFGYRKEKKHNAIYYADTPHIDRWFVEYPHAILAASGEAVGLLKGYVGNSEVGHLTIGAGRVIPQPARIIGEAIENGTFFTNALLKKSLQKLKKNNNTVHIIGLLSDAGVHAHEKHIYAFVQAAVEQSIKTIVVHPILDGRDTPPKSASYYLQRLTNFLNKIGHGVIGSLHGRFYAIDRDNHWERIEKSYRVLTEIESVQYNTWKDIINGSYAHNITDEFVIPTQIKPGYIINDGDGIIFCNFRPDRARQLTASFVYPQFDYFPTKKLDLSFFITPILYDEKLNTTVLFPTEQIKNTLKDVLVKEEKTIFSIAETEKYAHVTYFFNGGREKVLPGETRLLIPSISVKNCVANPAMSAPKITVKVLESLQAEPKDFYLINYANADMVGHSGNFEATVKAVSCLDKELAILYKQVIEKMNGTLYIMADHGNAEDMYDEVADQPRTAHTTNPVPFIMIRKNLVNTSQLLPLQQLSDVAPFILHHMKLLVPPEMGKIKNK
ncbi:MAG: 2,3-bisphosphoglycerate-independent phosphoglycerate mutase [Candidatus Babeliales bacterium]